MNTPITQAMLWMLLILSLPAAAQCEIDEAGLYGQFKQYREQVNSAVSLEQLTPYFSTKFNQYYRSKLEASTGAANRKRYLTHYWDNLNTAKDVVIVYSYAMQCHDSNNVSLLVLAILDQGFDPQRVAVDMWEVKIHYQRENSQWLIDSFEYQRSGAQKFYETNQIVDNFATIR